MTENPFSTQGWNRYSYVGNSPLNFTDPSGYCFAGCFWKPVLSGIQKALVRSPILRVVVQVVLVALCEGNFACALLVSAATSAAVTGITGGNLSQSLRAGLIAATSALAMNIVGGITTSGSIENIAGHAAVGCGMAVASGGKCGQGAASAAIGAAGAPLISAALSGADAATRTIAGAAASATLGGLASVASGGKFATGAETAAFGYLFNNDAHAWLSARGCQSDFLCSLAAAQQQARQDFYSSGRAVPQDWVLDLFAGGVVAGARGAVASVRKDLLLTLSGDDAVLRAARSVDQWLGASPRVVQGESSDLILRSADGTRQLRFDLTNPHGLVTSTMGLSVHFGGLWSHCGKHSYVCLRA